MLGAIIGDICGSVYEFNPVTSKDFPLMQEGVRFTDDTVLSVAIADALLQKRDFALMLKEYVKLYPRGRGYGPRFFRWAFSKSLKPYNSLGNGGAMRVSCIGYWCNSIEEVLDVAKQSAEVTHNHKEGIKAAQAVALAVFLAKEGFSKHKIKQEIELRFSYNLSRTIEEIRKNYSYTMKAPQSVPEAIIAFLESNSYESAIRNAIYLQADADTQACIAGGIAEAYYKEIPLHLKQKAYEILDKRLIDVIEKFYSKIGLQNEKTY